MKLIKPSVEWWQQKSLLGHIARVGRICYKSEGRQPEPNCTSKQAQAFLSKRDKERCESFWNAGHRSMYRHGSAYFFVQNDRNLPPAIWALLQSSPYVSYVPLDHKVWISTNMQFLCENRPIYDVLNPFGVEEDEFIAKAQQYHFGDALSILRMTFVVTTQISTSRELNRTSPNAIAEQSTRYCNLERQGGVQIAEPCWYASGSRWQRFLYRFVCGISDWAYRRLLISGLKPQDARGVLPLDTYTRVAYTYNLYEWGHILDLRYHGTTGRPHPNAYEVCRQIHDIITERMIQYIPEFKI